MDGDRSRWHKQLRYSMTNMRAVSWKYLNYYDTYDSLLIVQFNIVLLKNDSISHVCKCPEMTFICVQVTKSSSVSIGIMSLFCQELWRECCGVVVELRRPHKEKVRVVGWINKCHCSFSFPTDTQYSFPVTMTIVAVLVWDQKIVLHC